MERSHQPSTDLHHAADRKFAETLEHFQQGGRQWSELMQRRSPKWQRQQQRQQEETHDKSNFWAKWFNASKNVG